MTLAGLVAKNALRNKRRTVPTILSIGFSILLLTIMLTLWRSFYLMTLVQPLLFASLPELAYFSAMPCRTTTGRRSSLFPES